MSQDTCKETEAFRIMVRAMGEYVCEAFEAKFERRIILNPIPKQDENGNAYLDFAFCHVKPGLLPTAIEKEWFQGFIAGYKTATNIGMLAQEELLNREATTTTH